MQDVLKNNGSEIQKCNVTFWHGCKKDVLYRRQFFNYNLGTETHWRQTLNLADFPVEYGIIRADKLRLFRTPIELTLGAYGFPDNGTEIIRKENGQVKAVILKGYDHTGQEKQLAMTIYDGWDELDIVNSTDTNPDSKKSVVVYAKTPLTKQYGYENFILISQVITKESHADFEEDELFPIASIDYIDKERCGGYGPVTITLKNGMKIEINFDRIEGNLQL